MKRVLLIPVIVLTLLGSACSSLPKAPSTQALVNDDYSLAIEYLEKYIPAQMKKHRLTGVSVALVDGQRVVWSDGFGFADESAGEGAIESTAYGAGSVSKLFTAMAIMKLDEEQKLDLDAPIRDSVPEFDLKSRFGSIDEITLRNILSHHAGIPGAIIDGMWTNEPDSFKTVTTRLNRYYAAYPPNTVFAYSNAGYSLAGHAVELASGMPFTGYIEESLLRPLDMTHSNFQFDATGENVAKSYWNGKEVQTLGLRDLPAGGLITTVGDLSHLIKLVNGKGIYQSRLFAPETLQEMLAVQDYSSAIEPDGFNGIGWFHFSRFLDDKYTVVGHTGQTMAHSAILVIAPEIELGVVLLANSPSNGGLENITDEMLRVSHTVKTGRALSTIAAPDKTPAPLYGTETGFDGQYASTFGYLNITGDTDRYELNIGGNKMSLTRQGDGGHALRARLLGFIPIKPPGLGDLSFFARDVSGKKLIYARRPGVRTDLVATQLVTQERNPAWDARLGDYTLANPIDTEVEFLKIEDVSLAYADGVYHLHLTSSMANQDLPLKVINDAQATLQGYGRGLGETLMVQDDGSLLHAGMVLVKQ